MPTDSSSGADVTSMPISSAGPDYVVETKQASESSRPEKAQSSAELALYILAFGGLIIFFVALLLCPHKSWWVSFLFGVPVMAQVVGGGFHIRNHPKDHD